MTMCGKMSDPDMNTANERSVTYNLDFEEEGEFSISLSDYTLNGSFFAPGSVITSMRLIIDAGIAESTFPVVFHCLAAKLDRVKCNCNYSKEASQEKSYCTGNQ